MPEDFAALRAKNIATNKALLQSLGLDIPTIPQKQKPAPKTASSKPKKRKSVTEDNNESSRPTKMAKSASATDELDASEGSRRRSLRNAAKPRLSYSESLSNSAVMSENIAKAKGPQVVSEAAMKFGREVDGNRIGKRKHDPKTFGEIPGITVGTWWETRMACSTDAVHAPPVSGIAGSVIDGAYSVALSGGYDDDVDLGNAFTYTGSGGRDLKGTKTNPKNLRTAPQSSDQSFDNPFNAALLRSVETKKPVRVIRGYKLDSPYAPTSGYRYDGLYTVEKAWLEPGLNKQGFKVCKFAFKRVPGQVGLPVAGEGERPTVGNEEQEEELDESTSMEENGDAEGETVPTDVNGGDSDLGGY